MVLDTQSPAAQVDAVPSEHLQKWLAVGVIPEILVASFWAAVCIPALSIAVASFCAPYPTPARAALTSVIYMYARRPISIPPVNKPSSSGRTTANSTRLCPRRHFARGEG